MQRKRIAVITARADHSEQRAIINGIAEAALSLNTDVVVFSNIYNHWVTDEILNYENIIYNLFIPELFDGVIITAEAFMDLSIINNVFKRIKASGITAVIIDGAADGFISVTSDDETDLQQITEHLISVHGFTNIDILTGFKNAPVSHRRVSGCKKAFEKHSIPFDETKVYFGNFWDDAGEQLAKRYLNKEIPLPQAVICTNDYMAYGLCDTLTAAGIDIPTQITVTGYDHTDGRIYHHPILTTYRRSRRQMGIDAVNQLLSTDYSPAVENRFVCGNTCDCGVNSNELNEEIRAARIGQYHSVMSSVAQFASRLTLCRTIDEYTTVLGDFFYLLHGAKNLYFCLDKAWNSEKYEGEEFLCCTIGDKGKINTPEKYSKGILLPALTEQREKPMIFYFSPLCFQTRLFGYTALTYEYPQCYDLSFRDWNKTVANTLEFLRMKNDIHYLTQCQRISSLYDSLTGFFNLHEFRQITKTAGTEYSDGFHMYAVKLSFNADGEYLYGENYRSDIISAIAKAIKQSCGKKEICCRADEDTFIILCRTDGKTFSDKLKVMIHHALCNSYDESQVVISYAQHIGVINESTVDKLCQTAKQIASKHTDIVQERKKMPHYNTLLEIHNNIHSSPQTAPTIDELSKRLCVSDGYFRAIYKKCFGISYVQDCINSRIMLACYLLCTTAMSIYTIALKCGYNDEKYFARQFRQITGCSPIQYRSNVC